MKMTRRIFIALLILAVSVSSFAVFANAAEPEAMRYEDVLEYFEEQALIDLDFDNNANYSDHINANRPSGRTNQFTEQIVTDPESPLGQYFSISISERSKRVAYSDNHIYFAWTSDVAIDDFNIDMIVSGSEYNSTDTEDDENLPKIVIVVGDTEFATMAQSNLAQSGTTLAAIDYRGGFFTYYKDGAAHKTSYAIEADAWYNVSLTYDVDNGMSITIFNCADPANSLTVTDGSIPFSAVKDIRIGTHGNDNGSARGSEMKFASVRLLGGVYHREISNMQADIEEKVLAMYNIFSDDSVGVEDKIAICEVVKKVSEYGFTTEDANVQAALDELSVGALGLYNSKIAEFVGAVDSLATFAEKRAYADEVQVYVTALAGMDLTDATPDMVENTAKNIADFYTVNDGLNAVEAASLNFIAIAESVKDNALVDYTAIVADIARFDGVTPDATYEGVAGAYVIYNDLVEAEENIRVSANLFIEAVNVANDDTLDFNTRAEAYTSIEVLYFDNETYPGVTEAIAIYVDVLGPYMSLEISNAENFIKYVNKADYALYISAKQENLDIAKTYMDICQPHFEGVAEAKVLYAEIQAYINEQIANANAYIAAVDALDSLSGDALITAIANAQGLQAAGNVLGVDGVTEANIKLNQAIAAIELTDRYCVHFIALVNSLDKAANASETYAILAEAIRAEIDADQSYAGVANASIKLAQAISEFNAQVNAINAEFAKANDVAANTCGLGGAEKAPVSSHVIALIKKFFDEE